MTALSEARAELRELEAKRASLVQDIAAAKAVYEPLKAKAEAYRARRRKVPVVVNAANEHKRDVMADLMVTSWDMRQLAGKKAKDVSEAIASGGVSVGLASSGITYKARGLHQRTRIPHPADLRAWDRAQKAEARAYAALDRARKATKEAARLAYENGTKIEFDAFVADLTRDTVLRAAADAAFDRSNKEGELARMVDGQYGSLSIAKRHVDHLSGKVPLPEGQTCSTCQRQAQDSAARDSRIAAIKALPRRKFTCPTHGRVIGYAGRSPSSEWVQNEDGTQRQVQHCPLLYCPKDWKRYIDSTQLAKDDAKAAKPQRAAKPAKEVEFACPNPECGEDVFAEVHDGIVECGVCGVEFDVSRVKIIKGKVAA